MWRNGITLVHEDLGVYFQVDQNYDFIQVFVDVLNENCSTTDPRFDEISEKIQQLFTSDDFQISVISSSPNESDMLVERQRERLPFQFFGGTNKVRKVKSDQGYEDLGILCYLNSFLGDRSGKMRELFSRNDMAVKVVIPDTRDKIRDSDLLLLIGPDHFNSFKS